MSKHQLFKDGDADCPPQILDRNGQVALSLCRKCGQGEGDLQPECPVVEAAVIRKPTIQEPNKLERDLSTLFRYIGWVYVFAAVVLLIYSLWSPGSTSLFEVFLVAAFTAGAGILALAVGKSHYLDNN